MLATIADTFSRLSTPDPHAKKLRVEFITNCENTTVPPHEMLALAPRKLMVEPLRVMVVGKLPRNVLYMYRSMEDP